MSIQLETQNFDISRIIEDIERYGATSIRIIPEETRVVLLTEAESYRYADFSSTVGPDTFWTFPTATRFHELRDQFQELLNDKLTELPEYPFRNQLSLRDMLLLRYTDNTRPIPPHSDDILYTNLICLFMLRGRGRFFVCSDENGTNSLEIDATPGNVVLMRAFGFKNYYVQQNHYVTDVIPSRNVFVLRQADTC